ncbi:MAG TPA: enolase C-terminal domain-like protein [Candidatus Binatia bacterium]|nr:enolase C-terminal domain-like protein [Candidatus Binatia bacterium]
MTAAPPPGRRIPFRVGLRHPVLGVTQRSGWLIEGRAGWAEWSPLPSWSRDEVIAAYRGAVEAAEHPFPDPIQASVAVNAMIPRVAPEVAARMAAGSPCSTLKVKVGDPEGEARVGAVREAAGAGVRIRVDANGAWTVEEAVRALSRLRRYSIEYAEDPVATLPEMAVLRRRAPLAIAAEMPVRVLEDVAELGRLAAADLLVVKPQRIGGIRAALLAAELCGVPVVVSSALETSIGLSACLAVAAALPSSGHAHGIGTATLLSEDVTTEPLLPLDGRLTPRRVEPDLLLAGAPGS